MTLLLGDFVRLAAGVVGDKTAYVFRHRDGDRTVVTYRQFDEQVNRLAHTLRSHGVSRGDRVAVLLPNHPLYPVVYFAGCKLGAVVVPINARYQADEVAEVVRSCRPRVTLAHPTLADRLPTADAPVLLVDRELPDPSAPSTEPDLPAAEQPRDHDPHACFFTSGTTGRPKGVLQTQRSYALLARQPTFSTRGSGEFDVGLCLFPFFHMSGWATSICFWAARATVVLLERPDPVAVLDAIEAERVTQLYAIPEVLRAVCADPGFDRRDLSSVIDVSSGTSAMTETEARAFADRFGVAGLGVHYGSSEAGQVLRLPAEEFDRRPTSVGRPVPGAQVRLVDADGRDVEAGQSGEIWVRSDFVMTGYLDAPELTAEAFVDGWFRTGDLGVVDGDGYWSIVGRVRDVIRSGGETIVPGEIEGCIAGLAGVADVAVVGVADARWGEAPAAAVVVEAAAIVEPDDVVAWCRERLAGFKTPRRVRLVDELPRDPVTGKVRKAEVRAWFEERVGT